MITATLVGTVVESWGDDGCAFTLAADGKEFAIWIPCNRWPAWLENRSYEGENLTIEVEGMLDLTPAGVFDGTMKATSIHLVQAVAEAV